MEAAIDWLIRQRDPAFADWEAFTAWLEADRRNAEAYAELAARDEEMAERLAATQAVPHSPGVTAMNRRGLFAGLSAIAASVVAVAIGYQLLLGSAPYTVVTPPGVQRTIALAGGSRLALNGGTEIELDRNDPRYAELKTGEASFDIVHDAHAPFRVKVQGAELVDLGTRFNVIAEPGLIEVAVAEGVVMYNPDAEAIRLTPGRRLRARGDEALIALGNVPAESIGAWAEGRLVYDNVPLSEVARDLSRTLGRPVRVEPAIAGRPVTAVVQVPRDRRQLAPRLEKLLDVKVSQTGSDWVLTTSR
jgi:transmembrane sensor